MFTGILIRLLKCFYLNINLLILMIYKINHLRVYSSCGSKSKLYITDIKRVVSTEGDFKVTFEY